MAYKQNPARGQSDSYDSNSFKKWRNGEGDPPMKTETSSSRDDEGLLTVVTTKTGKSSGASSGGKLASKEKWNQFLNTPEGKLYSQKKKEKTEITQVPSKPAVKIESGTNVRDVMDKIPQTSIDKDLSTLEDWHEEGKKRGGSSMHSKGRFGMQMKQFFTSKGGGGKGYCPECLKKSSKKYR